MARAGLDYLDHAAVQEHDSWAAFNQWRTEHQRSISLTLVAIVVAIVAVVGVVAMVDGTPREVANVVWATGFQQVFDWIRLPIIDEDGYPREKRGVVDEAPGLFFCGLSFQYSFSSMLVSGAGRDADHVADRIAARAKQDRSVT